jgi:hypothetical protein
VLSPTITSGHATFISWSLVTMAPAAVTSAPSTATSVAASGTGTPSRSRRFARVSSRNGPNPNLPLDGMGGF